MSWGAFASLVARELDLDTEPTRESKLIADLECDSFSVVVLAAILWEESGAEFPNSLALDNLMVGHLYDAYCVAALA